jgi:arginase
LNAGIAGHTATIRLKAAGLPWPLFELPEPSDYGDFHIMTIDLLIVPYDTARRGWRMGAGPGHLLQAGLEARLSALGHTVRTVPLVPAHPNEPAEIATAFELMAAVAGNVREGIVAGRFPLVLSGNCNPAVGVLAGLAPARRSAYWFDAHGDCNTPETTTTGFLDGTGLATAMGWGWRQMALAIPGFEPVPERHVLLLGVRDVDVLEGELLARSAVTRLSPADVRGGRLGAALTSMGDAHAAYVHCDLDVLDPTEGQANCFPVPGGLSVDEVEEAIRAIGRASPVKAAAITSYAPEFDPDGRIQRAAFRIIEAIMSAAAR